MIPLLLLAALPVFGQALPMSFSNLPACGSPRVKLDANGGYLLLKVQDPSGAGLEIWCAKEPAGYNFEYRLAGGDGSSRRLDRCQLPDGLNSAGVEHEGPVAEQPLSNGGQLLRTAGRLVRFTHNNWDTRRGHHAIYDFRRQQITYYDTLAYQDGIGRWIKVLNGANSYPLAAIPQSEPAAALGKTPSPRSFDPNRVACVTALTDDGQRMHEEEVNAFVEPGKAGKLTLAWPESSQIEKIDFDAARRELHIKLPATARKTMISIAYPRTLLGLAKEITHVRLDGRFVEAEEVTTATHKTIRFAVDEPAREALLNESGGFPFFAVSGVAITGGILIGGVIGLLFRRKLPPVADDA